MEYDFKWKEESTSGDIIVTDLNSINHYCKQIYYTLDSDVAIFVLYESDIENINFIMFDSVCNISDCGGYSYTQNYCLFHSTIEQELINNLILTKAGNTESLFSSAKTIKEMQSITIDVINKFAKLLIFQ